MMCVLTQSCLTLETLWTVTHQAPLSMGLPRQEYWSRLPFPSLRDCPHPGIELKSPALQVDSLPSKPMEKCIHTTKNSPNDIL